MLKITYLAQASVLIEFDDKKLLMDPWLVGPSWGGNLWLYPEPRIDLDLLADIDYLYFSHAHEDHLHPESISKILPCIINATILIPNFGFKYFEKAVRSNGLNNIRILENHEEFFLSKTTSVKIYINENGEHDSSLLFKYNGFNLFFQTDNLMGVNKAKEIGEENPINLAFVISSLTGIFPAFYNFDPKDYDYLYSLKKNNSMEYCYKICEALNAKHVIPYATDICYLGHLYFINDIQGYSKTEFKKFAELKSPKFDVILMGPDDKIFLINNQFSFNLNEHDFDKKYLGGHAVSKLNEVLSAENLERKYENLPYYEDIEILRSSLDENSVKWTFESFRVMWKIINLKGISTYFTQTLPDPTENYFGNFDYDLLIELPSYRLQRLVRGDYKMGFLTLQNGSIRCHRLNKSLSILEKEFWNWAMININFYSTKIIC